MLDIVETSNADQKDQHSQLVNKDAHRSYELSVMSKAKADILQRFNGIDSN